MLNIIIGLSNIVIGFVVVVLAIPLIKGKIKMNIWYGIRIPKSFRSDENWYKINKYGGRRLLIWGFPIILIGFISFFISFDSNLILVYLFSLTPLLVLIPVLDTIIYARKI